MDCDLHAWRLTQCLPQSLVGSSTYVSAASYNAAGQPTSISLGNTVKTSYLYDAQRMRLLHLQVDTQGSLLDMRFGMLANGGRFYVQYADNGYNWTYPADLIANVQLNTWYVLQIVVDDSENGFVIEVYQESDPSVQGSYRVRMPAGKQWRFHHWIYRGNAYLDDYREFNEGNRFSYDALDRLTRAWTAGSDVAPYDQSYTYDAIGNITGKSGVGSYGYGDTAHKHAVTHLDGVQQFWYDANGNMITRVEGGVTYNQTFDIENRLVSVTANGQTTTFTYDGDGRRVKKVDAGGTTYTPGEHYEVKGGVVTKYYYLGRFREVLTIRRCCVILILSRRMVCKTETRQTARDHLEWSLQAERTGLSLDSTTRLGSSDPAKIFGRSDGQVA